MPDGHATTYKAAPSASRNVRRVTKKASSQDPVPGTGQIVPAVARLTRAFRDARRPVAHMVRLYLPDGSNADICRRSLIASGARLVIAEDATSGFGESARPEMTRVAAGCLTVTAIERLLRGGGEAAA
ncbi:hypothetical protein GCM10017786_10870 [Amycolatopsis deserti]|uniref:Uncharacterized protein n=1 Tax=Amycolatopsis deserti TaxID=185696 RepID=A0ABQ3IIS7_9PSEU|nr:hypothetical protein GCM10017786_10870 [Amycolatopsis deserti]